MNRLTYMDHLYVIYPSHLNVMACFSSCHMCSSKHMFVFYGWCFGILFSILLFILSLPAVITTDNFTWHPYQFMTMNPCLPKWQHVIVFHLCKQANTKVSLVCHKSITCLLQSYHFSTGCLFFCMPFTLHTPASAGDFGVLQLRVSLKHQYVYQFKLVKGWILSVAKLYLLGNHFFKTITTTLPY